MALGLGLVSASLYAAGKADQQAPMEIEADALQYDDRAQRSVFTGHVQVSKGSIVMRGSRLEVRQDAAGNQFGTLTGGTSPAFYRQQRQAGSQEFVEAQAQSMTYSSQTGVVTLTGQAVFRRLQGQEVLDRVSGHTISYNGNTDVFTVNGGAASNAPGAVTSSGGRVRVTLSGRSNSAAPAPAPEATPVSKPSLQLDSAKPVKGQS